MISIILFSMIRLNLKWPMRSRVFSRHFNSLPLGDAALILEMWFSNSSYKLISRVSPGRLLPCECYTFDDKSTMMQRVDWCCQATSHYLGQCWPRFMSLYWVTRPQFVNSSQPSVAYMPQWTGSALVQIMACRLTGAKPLSESMLEYC